MVKEIKEYLEKIKEIVGENYNRLVKWYGTDEMNSSSVEHIVKYNPREPVRHLDIMGDDKW